MAEKKKPGRGAKPETRKLVSAMKENAKALDGKGRRGRVPVYDPDVHPRLAYEYALLGISFKRMAHLMLVDEVTVHDWRKEHPEFSQAVIDGRDGADAAVAKALFQRATGYSHEDVHIATYQGDVIQTPIVKHYPPEVSAATFWLKNRASTQWRDRQEVDNTSSDGSMTPSTINRIIVRPGDVPPAAAGPADDELGED